MTSVEPYGIANWQKELKQRKIPIQYFISPVQNVDQSTQGENNFLDNLLWVSCKLTGISPTKLGDILTLLNTGYDKRQHHFGELVQEKVIPTIHQQYLKKCDQIFEKVKQTCQKKGIGATITWDGGYASRNKNSDHAAVSFVEHVTGKNLLLHLEMSWCSKELMPQSNEKELIFKGFNM